MTVLAAGITFVMYLYTQELMKESLQRRLVSIVSTAAIEFDADTLESLTEEKDMERPEYAEIVTKLQAIRSSNVDVKYAYIMRRTHNPEMFEFVADAESLTPAEDLDENGNGEVDPEEEAPFLGMEYSVTEFPVLRDEAFYHPAVDRSLQPDDWGLVMAAYAPIRNDDGEAVAIIGIDVQVNDFVKRTQQTLLPFLLFIIFLILVLSLISMLLMRANEERMQVIREIDQHKDEVLSIVSHQLATPISSVKLLLETLFDGDEGPLNENQTTALKKIQMVNLNLLDLVHMILDVSRIQLGKMQINKSEVNMQEFVEEISEPFTLQAKSKNVTFVRNVPGNLPVAIFDRRLLRMPLENLLSNAVKYTPEGGSVTFTVTYDGKNIGFEVRDTGYGIPLEDQKNIFGKMYRASNVTKIDGNGLGLFVAKGSVEAHDGTISFVSVPGKGTTFTISLPVILAQKSA